MTPTGECNDLALVLEALKTSTVAEDRSQALEDLCKSFLECSSSEEQRIVAELTTCWAEKGDSSLHDDKWRTNICRVGSSRLPKIHSSPEVFMQYVQLACKACMWCAKCMCKQTLSKSGLKGVQRDDILKVLAVSKALPLAAFAVAEDCSYLLERQVVQSVALLVREALRLVQVLCVSREPRRGLEGSEMNKAGLDLITKGLRVVYKVNLTITAKTSNRSAREEDLEALLMIKSVMKDLEEVGLLSARVEWGKLYSTGGRSIGTNIVLLNSSWRSCVTMLTLSEGSRMMLAPIVGIEKFIMRLILFGTYSMKLAFEVWPSPKLQTCGSTSAWDPSNECRRCAVIVKYFFALATRLCTFYPEQAIALRCQLVDSVLKFSSLLSHTNETPSKHAAEILAEFAGPTVFGLLHSLLCVSKMHLNLKVKLLQSIGSDYEPPPAIEDVGSGGREPEDNVCLSTWDDKVQGGFLSSRVMVFLQLLERSREYTLDLQVELAKQLDWVLDSVAEHEVYASLLQSQIFLDLSTEPSKKHESTKKPQWQLMYLRLLKVLEGFVIRISLSSDGEAWAEIQDFLFRCALHPSAICGEMIRHLWGFIAKHSEKELVEGHVSTLVSLLRAVAADEESQTQAVKRLAQIICGLVEANPEVGASHLFSLVFDEEPFATLSSASMVSALLQEGFSLALLPDVMRKDASVNFLKHCLAAAKPSIETEGSLDGRIRDSMWCLLHLLHQSEDSKVIDPNQMQEVQRLTLDSFTKESRSSTGYQLSGDVTGAILLIVLFFLKQKAHPKTLRILLVKVQELVKSVPRDDAMAIKPALAEFVSSLSSLELPEEDGDLTSEAVWYLYHTVLREQHWALVHSGLASFSQFAEKTNCKELWRFVPADPGFASDVFESTESGADMFMRSLGEYLEKRTTCTSLTMTDSEIDLLRQEAKKQRSSYLHILQQKEREIPEEKTIVVDFDSMDVDTEPPQVAGVTDNSVPEELKTVTLMLQEAFSILSSIPPSSLSTCDSRLAEWESIISQLADVNEKLASL